MSGLSMKVKAPDPHLLYPEVSHGERADRRNHQGAQCTTCHNKYPGDPRPGHLSPTTRMETLAKVFRVNLPANVEKRPFSATDGILSREPEFSALPHRHQRMQRGRADQVCASWQVSWARAQRALDSKGPTERLARLRQSFIKLINH